MPRSSSPTVKALVVLLLASCSFEVQGPEGFQFKDDSSGGDALVEVAETHVAEIAPDVAPDIYAAPDEFEVAETWDFHEECGQDQECVSDIECVEAACMEGECVFTPTDALCADHDGLCTTGVCNPDFGCEAQPMTGEECDPGSNCVVKALCTESGECEIIEKVLCQKPCYSGECNEESGECIFEVEDGGPCSDESECTGSDTCLGGECVGTPIPGKCPCVENEDCDSFPVADLCQGKLACFEGLCDFEPGSQVECEPSPPDSCMEHTCLPETGKCAEVSLPAGALCDDLNQCTMDDKCTSAGKCAGSVPVNQEDETIGCDVDGTTCTLDYCLEGECKPGPQKPCPSTGQCSQSVCEFASGECLQMPLSGTPCDDGVACTKDDECAAGVCTPGMNVCVDCTAEGLAGHPCSDDDDATQGDFCFGHNCVGLTMHTWEPTGCESSALNKLSSSGNSFHAIGVKGCGDNDFAPRFFEVSTAGVTGGESTILGSTPLADIDGEVAVGKPQKFYQHVNDWLVATELKGSLQEACPCLGSSCAPVTVLSREKDGINIGGLSTERAAFVGMHVDSTQSNDCFMAVCFATLGSQWECSGMPYSHLEVPAAAGMEAEASSLWVPVDWSSCNGTFMECLGETGEIYVAVRAWSSDDASVTPFNALLSGAKEINGEDFLWTVIHQDEPADESPAEDYRINDIRRDENGNFFAVGSNGFILVQDASGATQIAPPFLSLAPGAIHYQGIYRNDYATVIAANHLVVTSDSEGEETYEVRAGLLAGSGDLLLGNLSVEQPFFNELSVFSICTDCYSQEFGNWGLSDLAVRMDHPSGLVDLGSNKAVLGVCGTSPEAFSGSPRGHISILTP